MKCTRGRWVRALCPGFVVALAFGLLAGCAGDPTGPAPEDWNAEPEPGDIQTWAGTGLPGFNGDEVALREARLYFPMDLTIASNGDAYLLDWNNHQVRLVESDGTFRTVMGEPIPGDGQPNSTADLQKPGVPGTTIRLNHPTDMIELPDGTFLLSSWHNHKLRHYDPSTGLVYVICGRSAGYAGDGQPMSQVQFSQPPHTELGPDGAYYVMDQRNQRIRRVDPNGIVTTVVGNPIGPTSAMVNCSAPEFGGDGGPPAMAQIGQPGGSNPQPGGSLTFDDQGRLYFCDVCNNRIRRVDFDPDPSASVIETVVGNGTAAWTGDGGLGTAASLNNPRDVEFGPDGRLYIADELNHAVRAWDPATGKITTVAGIGVRTPATADLGAADFSGDGGPATSAMLYRPAGLEFDADGLLYIADSYNHRVRRVKLEGN